MPKKPKSHPPSESTAAFIRTWLLKNKKDYPYRMFKAWCAHLERLQMKPPKQTSFMKFFYCLRRAGLVRRTTTPRDATAQKRKSPFKERHYYELMPNKPSDQARIDEAWRNVQVFVYGERMRLGRKQYRKQILHLPVQPRKLGRPRTSKVLDFLEGKPID